MNWRSLVVVGMPERMLGDLRLPKNRHHPGNILHALFDTIGLVVGQLVAPRRIGRIDVAIGRPRAVVAATDQEAALLFANVVAHVVREDEERHTWVQARKRLRNIPRFIERRRRTFNVQFRQQRA